MVLSGVKFGFVELVLLCFQIAKLRVHQFFERNLLVVHLLIDFSPFAALPDPFVKFLLKFLVGLDALLDFAGPVQGMGVPEHDFLNRYMGSVEVLLRPFQ